MNIFKYFSNNIGSLISIIISVALGVASVYLIFGIGGNFIKIIDRLSVEPIKNQSFYYDSSEHDSKLYIDKMYTELTNLDSVDYLFKGELNNTSMRTILGSIGSRVFGVSSQDLIKIMKAKDYEISEGRMPVNNDEIILNEDYAKANGYKVGEFIGNDVDDYESLTGKKKVTGFIKSNEIINYYINNDIKEDARNTGYIVIFNNEDGLNKIVEKYKNNIQAIDEKTYSGFVNSFNNSFKGLGIFIMIFFIILEWIVLGNLFYINMLSRKEELALMNALGRSKSWIILNLLKENFLVVVCAFVLGAILGLFGTVVINEVYLKAHGQGIDIVNGRHLFYSSLLPIILGLTVIVPIKRFFRKVDLIEILEGR
ncbi:FtsX-like permease family protein [Clostridium sp. YIM B02551]|uniref:FtsX-like permease family protein n=1 Tax=Clostridium sp. YIM B02551 TaxID=2910679 RepID=UPI001EE9E6C1|nr:ABC transporter permease [Clostridium sp. YIM B02551]